MKQVGLVGVLLFTAAYASSARAEHFTLLDVTYDHGTTLGSHYFVRPAPPSSPKNWRAPIDWSKGKAYLYLDVIAKPSDVPTRMHVCFLAFPVYKYACAGQSPVYTKPGSMTWSTEMSRFLNANDPDWTQGLRGLSLILKDDKNGQYPAGDKRYYPAKMRVKIVMVSPGDSYVPALPGDGPSSGGGDAGAAADAQVGDTRPPNDAREPSSTVDARPAPPADAEPVVTDPQPLPEPPLVKLDAAPSSSPRRDGATAVTDEPRSPGREPPGCSAGSAPPSWTALWLLLAVWGAARGLRRTGRPQPVRGVRRRL